MATNFLDADVTPNIDGVDPDFGTLQFFYMNQPAPGTWNLAAAPDNNYATCEHCVVVYADNGNGKTFFQQSGTMSVTSQGAAANLSVGSLTNVKLIEVTVDPNTFISTPVPNGECYTIASASWNTQNAGSSSAASSSAASSSASGGQACPAITLGGFAANSDPMYNYVIDISTVTPNIDGADPDLADIEFYFPGAPATGTFNFASSPDNNYGTCIHCMLLGADFTQNGPVKYFYPQSGTMTVTSFGAAPNRCQGSLSNVKLVEVTLDPNTATSTPVPNGECYTVTSASWNTK